jgi:ubiquinone/menaquinone biosynthesis C-methylase UbiE
MHEKRFNRDIERLRDPERIARLELERVVNLVLEGQEGVQTVLDVGTGTGVFAEQFAARGMQVAGLDVNPEMLLAAQHYVPNGTFREGIAENLPFENGSFDLIFMGLVLHETDDTLTALKETHRVALKRVAILEWPDEDQPIGPPRGDRLAAEKVDRLSRQAGFKKMEKYRLEALILYRLDR